MNENEVMAYDETPLELTDEEIEKAVGGCDPYGAFGDGPQNVLYVYVAKNYLALRNAPAFRVENEIGKMWNGDAFQSYGQYSADGTYVYGYSLSLRKEGWTNKNFLFRGRR